MQDFLTGFLLSLSLCLDLGIANIAIVKTGLEEGFLPSLLIGVGSAFGDLAYAVLSMLGISLLLHYIYVQWILWIGGTLVLVYFSARLFRDAFRPGAPDFAERRSQGWSKTWVKGLLSGLGLALASPSAILWFATVGGSLIAASNRSHVTTLSMYLFFMGFFCAGILWSLLAAYVSGRAHRTMGPRLLRLFSATSAVLFVYFAIRVFLSGLDHLI